MGLATNFRAHRSVISASFLCASECCPSRPIFQQEDRVKGRVAASEITRLEFTTYESLLIQYVETRNLPKGKWVHVQTIHNGMDQDKYLGNLLIQMYAKNGALADAEEAFNKMHWRNAYTWNIMLSAYAQIGSQEGARKLFDEMPVKSAVSFSAMIGIYSKQGNDKEALRLFKKMQLQGLVPNKVTFLCVLDSCASREALAEATLMHACIINGGFESDIAVGTSLINMYAKCGELKDARRIFVRTIYRDEVLWNSIISAYAYHGCIKEALQHFFQMRMEGITPTKITFVNILSVFSYPTAYVQCKFMHAHIVATGLVSDTMVSSSLVNVYSMCGSLQTSWRIFNHILDRTTISWNIMIAAFSRHGYYKEALQLFQQMQATNTILSTVTFVSILEACTSQSALSQGKLVHSMLKLDGVNLDPCLNTAVLNMYGRCGSIEDAKKIFNIAGEKNVVLWNAMLGSYGQHGCYKEAFHLFQEMELQYLMPNEVTFSNILSHQEELPFGKWVHAYMLGRDIVPDTAIGNSIISMYGKLGNLDSASEVFDEMAKWDVVSWSAIVSAYAQHGHGKEALQLFREMQLEGYVPNRVTFMNILEAFATHVALAEGKQLHASIICSGLGANVDIGNTLINMYSKCSSLHDAHSMFDKMDERNSISWNATIVAFAQHGCAKEAIKVFQEMLVEASSPTSITFVGVLSACSHVGLLNEGCHCFVLMAYPYDVISTVEHYTSIIDLLGRAGWTDEAEELFVESPFVPTLTTWAALLNACKIYDDKVRGKWAAQQVLEIDPDSAATYISLSNVCASVSIWNDEA